VVAAAVAKSGRLATGGRPGRGVAPDGSGRGDSQKVVWTRGSPRAAGRRGFPNGGLDSGLAAGGPAGGGSRMAVWTRGSPRAVGRRGPKGGLASGSPRAVAGGVPKRWSGLGARRGRSAGGFRGRGLLSGSPRAVGRICRRRSGAGGSEAERIERLALALGRSWPVAGPSQWSCSCLSCAYTAADDAIAAGPGAMANRTECLCLKALDELLMRFSRCAADQCVIEYTT